MVSVRGGAFWDCRVSISEWLLLALVSAMVMALHLRPILHSGLAAPLIFATAATSYLSPLSGFAFIAASQFLPFPVGSPYNPAQVGVLVWLPVTLLRYRRINLSGLWRLWPVLPWLLWIMLTTGEQVYLYDSEYIKALMYSVIACQLANESNGKFLQCVLGLSFGALLIMCAYWGVQVGLPIEICDWGNDREGLTRMGGVRADAVMVWPALLFGISGLLGLQITLASPLSPRPSPRWLTTGSLVLFIASFPPLVSTMSHGAFAGFAFVVVAFAWAFWKAAEAGSFSNARFKTFMNRMVLSLWVVAGLFAVDAFALRGKTAALQKYYAQTTEDVGLAASRSGVWQDSINTIMKYPLFGITLSGEKEVITSAYAASGSYLSHNVFLDFGRSTGIPGMLLLAFFFFSPAYQMWRSGNVMHYIPFLLAHFAMLIFLMCLSFPFYKTIWALWMLMAMAVAAPAPAGIRTRTHRRKSQSEVIPTEIIEGS